MKTLRPVLPAVLVCLGLNLALFMGMAFRSRAYLTDYRLAPNPDSRDYVLIGRNTLTRGEYSRSEEAPYVPDMLRTPVYPVFAGGLTLLGGPVQLYLTQALLHCCSCVLLFLLVRSYFGDRPAFWASLLLATDLAFVATNFEPMSETLFVFLVLASAVCVLPVDRGREDGWKWLLAGGALLGLATLTRPVGLYLIPLYVLAYYFTGCARGQLQFALRHPLTLAAPAVVLVGLWVARNAVVFSVAKLTTVDTHNLIYFVGAGAYQVKHDVTLEEAQALIARDYDVPAYREVQNEHRSKRSVASYQEQLRPAVWPVLMRYPHELVQASVLGVLKANVSHATGELAGLLGLRWEGARRLGENVPVLMGLFGWQILHTAAAWLLAGVGLLRVIFGRVPRRGWFLLLLLLYFTLTEALFGYEVFYRCRLPAVPFLFAFAGLGLSRPKESS